MTADVTAWVRSAVCGDFCRLTTPAAFCASGRVIEDRRFGIYDARRYRMHGEGEEEDEHEDKAVVVKSYRDSATFKRRHGLPLDDGGDEAGDAGELPVALTVGASRRRNAAQMEPAASSHRRERGFAVGGPASAPLLSGVGGADARSSRNGTADPPALRSLRADALPRWGCRAPRTALTRALEAHALAPPAELCRAKRQAVHTSPPAVPAGEPWPTAAPASSYGAEEPHALVDVPWRMVRAFSYAHIRSQCLD
jgi:hypothetical protein